MPTAEVYVSTDIESDGPIPGPHSMLSFGSAAFLGDSTLVSTFSANLTTLSGATGHPRTMAWWKTHPEAWEATRENTRAPEKVMPEYAAWLKELPGTPIFVAYPAGFDFTFINWYLHQFAGDNPFSHSALDVKTLAMALLQKDYSGSTMRNMPQRWFSHRYHTHVALDDAIEIGELFCKMLQELKLS